ncbi:DsbA family protein [soil metagenome]
MTEATTESTSSIEFFFDPGCPWTWATSRWLVEAAGRRRIDIAWRSLSLGVLNAGRDIPEQYLKPMEVAKHVHRVFAALREDRRNDLIGAVYTEYGRRVHHDAAEPTVELVRQIVIASGAAAYLGTVDEEQWDEPVEASTDEAVSLAGQDVGSPILAFGTPRFAISGPIVSPPPTGDDGVRLLDLVFACAQIPGFFELKRGRSSGPEFGPRP